jgi:hypothetical protein
MRSDGLGMTAKVLALTTLMALVVSCTSKEESTDRPTVEGKPIGASSKACQGYLDRTDIQALLGDPTDFIQTERLYSKTFASCGIYDTRQKRYTLRFDISPNTGLFGPELKRGRVRPGAIVENDKAVAFPEEVGGNARALVRLPMLYVVVFLRQGPMTAERLTRLLAIAGKIAATVPAPFGTAKPTPTSTR